MPASLVSFYRDTLPTDGSADRCTFTRRARSYPKSVFPSARGGLPDVFSGLRLEPGNWKLHYYLGTLLTAKRRWQEGLDHFVAAEKSSPEFSVLYANLGAIYWSKLGDVKKAQAAFEKARSCDPGDYHYYVALDSLYAGTRDAAKRKRLFSEAPPEVESDFRVRFSRAAFHYDEEQYDDALKILASTTFTPWEGFTAVHQLYVRILNARAERKMQAGAHKEAIEDLLRAMEYPRNLGVGRPHNPDFGREYYRLGLCYQAIGEKDAAEQYWTKAVRSSPQSEWSGKAREALKKLGEMK